MFKRCVHRMHLVRQWRQFQNLNQGLIPFSDALMKAMLKTCLVAAGLIFALPSAFAQPVMIGYTNCVAVSSYSQSLINDITRFRWFFAHASVGGNMIDGIDMLRQSNRNQFPLIPVSEDEMPPASTQNGALYEFMRGNPGAQEKFDSFGAYVTNGWRYPKVNLVLDKLCYIDQEADLGYYLASMARLEAAFPETVFVYMTMPLTTDTDENNLKRNIYNDGVRDWTRTNNLVLFDIADMEAHDTNGVPSEFTYSGRVCQRLCDTYSSDGGHMNDAGKVLTANGFYALGAALLAVDRDRDGMSDGLELIAGTVPTSASSVFNLQASTAPEGGVALSWPGTTNRLYTLQRGTNLMVPESFTNIVTDLLATPPSNSYTDSFTETGPFFYRLQVKQ